MNPLLQLIEEHKKDFEKKFKDLQIYHHSYWGDPDEDGTTTAVPSKVTHEFHTVMNWHTASTKSVLEKVREGMEKDKRYPDYKDEDYCEYCGVNMYECDCSGYTKALQHQINLLTETINSLSDAGEVN